MTTRMPLVYLASPMTVGRPTRMHNVADATQAFEYLLRHGVASVAPAWSALTAWCLDETVDYEKWLELNFAYIAHCDGLVRLPGESKGADREVEYARSIGKPVFMDDDWRRAGDLAVNYFLNSVRRV